MILEFIIRLFIIGLTVFGGGPVFIPMMDLLLVKDLGIFTAAEFDTIVGIVNAVPGPVGPKIAGYAAFITWGPVGFLFMFCALVLPATTVMLVAIRYLDKLKRSNKFKKISTYISPVCVGIFLSISYTFVLKYLNLDSFLNFNNISVIFLIISSYLLLDKVKLDPMYVILLALTFGGITAIL